jgi:hypothetical protein
MGYNQSRATIWIAAAKRMDIFGRYWADLIGVAIVLVCVNGAITGRFYTNSRGRGKRLLAEVRSSRIRLVFLCTGVAMFVLVARDLVQKLGDIIFR